MVSEISHSDVRVSSLMPELKPVRSSDPTAGEVSIGEGRLTEQERSELGAEIDRVELEEMSTFVSDIVKQSADTNLSFTIEEGLSRMVVAVRAVGSDEIIRQFPPEEFLTVAKFIAAENPENLDPEFLKGILFDSHS